MEKGKRTVTRLLIILISFCVIDRGITLFISGSNKQDTISIYHSNELEMPHQQHLLNLNKDDDWVEVFISCRSCLWLNSVKILFTLNITSQEFSGSIWQPPKSV